MQFPGVREYVRVYALIFGACVLLLTLSAWVLGLRAPVSGDIAGVKPFSVEPGEGFLSIASRLSEEELVRSKSAFIMYLFLSGSAPSLKPGLYEMGLSMSGPEVVAVLHRGPEREVTLAIPEGWSSYRIDSLLADYAVLPRGEFEREVLARGLEGKMFPDTYRFFVGSRTEDVIAKFLGNFKEKALPILMGDEDNMEEHLILASILDREVLTKEDKRLVAGVLVNRISIGMALQVDATICYIKEMKGESCHPLLRSEFETDSPYNTYKYSGLPPGPIGNPGEEALRAAMDPKKSSYFFYLSDPETGKTYFSETFDEHEERRAEFLR